jgi:peptidoglycan hydrolase-like protein with peptidoglycan-binding domain
MEDNKEMVNESFDKIDRLMNFRLGMTATELKEVIEEQSRRDDRQARRAQFKSNLEGGMSRKDARQARQQTKKDQKAGEYDDIELGDNFEEDFEGKNLKHIDRFVRRLHRYNDKIDKAIAKLESSTHNGQSALEAVKLAYKEKYGVDLPKTGVTDVAATPAAQPKYVPKYQPCQGGINKVGCRSNSVAKVQAIVGGLDDKIKIDGMFGPRTKAAIEQVAPEFAEQFTDADVATIKQKAQSAGVKPKETVATKEPAPRRVEPKGLDLSKNPIASTLKPTGRDQIPRPAGLDEEDEVKEQGATNMAVGFMNESISQKERVRKNKEDRLNKKLGRV